VLRHELRHVEQVEANAIAGLALAIAPSIATHWLLGLAIWGLNPAICYLGGMVAAVIRGEHAYYGNHSEEAARGEH